MFDAPLPLEITRVRHGNGPLVLVHLGEADGVDRRGTGCPLGAQRGELWRLRAVGILLLDAIKLLERKAVVLNRLFTIPFKHVILGKFDVLVRLLKQPMESRRLVRAVGIEVKRPIPGRWRGEGKTTDHDKQRRKL